MHLLVACTYSCKPGHSHGFFSIACRVQTYVYSTVTTESVPVTQISDTALLTSIRIPFVIEMIQSGGLHV